MLLQRSCRKFLKLGKYFRYFIFITVASSSTFVNFEQGARSWVKSAQLFLFFVFSRFSRLIFYYFCTVDITISLDSRRLVPFLLSEKAGQGPVVIS